MYHFECKCKSCTLHFPPANSRGFMVTAGFFDVVSEFEEASNENSGQFNLNAEKFEGFEKSAIMYLQRNEHLHPARETLAIQSLLMLTWNTVGR